MRIRYQALVLFFSATLSLLPWHSRFAYAEEEKTGFLHQATLTGTWGGTRQNLADKGVNFEFIYTAMLWAM